MVSCRVLKAKANDFRICDISKRMGAAMQTEYNLKEMARKIQVIKQHVEELKEISGGIAAVDCNVNRISASLRVLELDVCDIADLLAEESV